MVETISISKLTKSYINNHDVMCRGVHCKYQETINGMSGGETKEYVVLNAQVQISFATLPELKNYIRNSEETETPKPKTKSIQKPKVIDEQLTVGKQSVNLVRIEENNGKKFKISIQSDSYDFQSYARMSLWDGVKWHQINSIHNKQMNTPHKLCYRSECRTNVDNLRYLFNSDVSQLRKIAHAIVF